MLLQMLDDGRLTDGQGRTVDFRNTVMIMTSNMPQPRTELRDHFRPEFLNRIDEIVIFERADTTTRSARSSSCSWRVCASGWPSGASSSS